MIEEVTAYKTSQGNVYPTAEAAVASELCGITKSPYIDYDAAKDIVSHRREIIPLLSSIDGKSMTNPLETMREFAVRSIVMALGAQKFFVCDYTNWRGNRARRTFCPIRLWCGSTKFHKEPGVILTAFDKDKHAERDFKFEDFDLSTLSAVMSNELIGNIVEV